MTTDIEALIAEWRETAKDVPAGPWAVDPREGVGEALVYCEGHRRASPVPFSKAICRAPKLLTADEWHDISSWLARCSPTDISALLDTIEALKADRDEAIKAADAALDLNEPIIARGDDWKARAEAAEKEASDLRTQLERAREALERLASPEAFTTPGMASPEDTARMKFAEAAARRIAQETTHG